MFSVATAVAGEREARMEEQVAIPEKQLRTVMLQNTAQTLTAWIDQVENSTRNSQRRGGRCGPCTLEGSRGQGHHFRELPCA